MNAPQDCQTFRHRFISQSDSQGKCIVAESGNSEGSRAAVIFDRDGVLNVDVGYAYRPDQIIWVPGAIEAVKMVNEAGLYAFVATNQSGVARGYYTEDDVQRLHSWMNEQMARNGAHIDAFEYSPFHPEGIVPGYAQESDCRKPGPGMLDKLLCRPGVIRDASFMVGDKLSDMQAAHAAGIEGLLFDNTNLLKLISARLAVVNKSWSH